MSSRKKKVLVVTGSRAEYGLLYPVMKEIQKSKKLQLRVLVTGMHTIKKYGKTITQIRRDKIPVHATVSVGENDSMLTALTKEIQGIAKYCIQHRPDILLVLGDRTEPFAGAIVAGYMKIAIAHMSGGDTSGYVVDEAMRHSISKFAQIHFPITRESAKRIEQLGEDPRRIHCVGSTAFDGISLRNLKSRRDLAQEFNLDPALPWLLVVQHPTPLDPVSFKRQIMPTIKALKNMSAEKIIIYPNSDDGSDVFLTAFRTFCSQKHMTHIPSLPRSTYLAFLKHVNVMIGNSSSGLIETGRFKVQLLILVDVRLDVSTERMLCMSIMMQKRFNVQYACIESSL